MDQEEEEVQETRKAQRTEEEEEKEDEERQTSHQTGSSTFFKLLLHTGTGSHLSPKGKSRWLTLIWPSTHNDAPPTASAITDQSQHCSSCCDVKGRGRGSRCCAATSHKKTTGSPIVTTANTITITCLCGCSDTATKCG